jgi:hypothetical protein
MRRRKSGSRLKSVIGHSMFGIGMYLTGTLMEAVG